jgi:TRAP-type C4-dicarboxylate transport system permease small subunit
VTVAPADAEAEPPAAAVVEPLGALQQFGGMRLGLLERFCQLVCAVAIVALAAIVLTEIVTRNLFNFSFQISDEVGGYIVVGLTFLALPVCQARQAYHHVMLIQARLPLRARELLNLGFDVLSLAFCAVLIWQLAWQTVQTWQSGDIAPTLLATPLWLPQAVMPIGCTILASVLVRGIVRRVQRMWRREF